MVLRNDVFDVYLVSFWNMRCLRIFQSEIVKALLLILEGIGRFIIQDPSALTDPRLGVIHLRVIFHLAFLAMHRAHFHELA